MKYQLSVLSFRYFQQQMNKYKTIDASPHPRQSSLEDAIQHRLITNRIARMQVGENEVDGSLMSTNKSIIFIKLPKKVQNHLHTFRSSLYESSLKRLKQQKVTILKQSRIPNITPKKAYQSLEDQAIRRVIKEKSFKAKEILPNVYNLHHAQELRKPYFLKSKVSQQIQEAQQEENFPGKDSNIHTQIPQHKSTFEIDGSIFGFKNLKQKYLELRQLSLNSKRKSELLQKHENRKSLFDDSFHHYDAKIKMEKQILQHMNRYMRKDFFQTKVNGLKTTIYPNTKGYHKKDDYHTFRQKQMNSVQEKKDISNFIKRKRIRSNLQNVSYEFPKSTFQIKYKDQQLNKNLIDKTKLNPEQYKRSEECTPWETDITGFD